MTYKFNVNTIPARGTACVYLWASNAISQASWIMTQWSDGLTLNVGGGLTSGNTGANGFDNPSAWMVMQMPGTTRQFCIQRNTARTGSTDGSSRYYRIKYSHVAGFTGNQDNGMNPADATHTPWASDQQVLLGGGTDASPTMLQQWFGGADGSLRCNVMADNATPYGTYMFFVNQGFSTIGTGCFVLDPTTQSIGGDIDPYIIYLASNSGTPVTPATTGSGGLNDEASGPFGYCGNVFTAGLSALTYSNSSTVIYPTQAGANSITGFDDIVPIIYARRAVSSPRGWKGFGTIMRYPSTARAALSTISVASPGILDNVLLNGTAGQGISLPWVGDSVTTPGV